MPLSGVTTVDYEDNRQQSQQFNHIPDSISSEYDPILRLYTIIKAQYSECAFVYALASNMCKVQLKYLIYSFSKINTSFFYCTM